MATCVVCGKKVGRFQVDGVGRCAECRQAGLTQKDASKQAEKNADIDAVVLTTETYPKRMNITDTIEVVTAECAFGMNMFKDLFAGVRNITGGRSEAVQKTMRDSRRTALYELKKEASEVGANAVVGIDLDYVELSAAGNMVMLVASGTAVRIQE